MSAPSYKIDISLDAGTGRVLAAYMRVREGEVAETREVEDGRVYADYDAAGQLLGIETLAPCDVKVLDSLASREPEGVRGFFAAMLPPALVA